MRDFQLQTPQREQNQANRKLKTASDLNRNLRKTAKKSLNPVFKADSEDDSGFLESLKEFSEASDDNLFAESTENFLASVNPAETQSSESIAASDVTSMLSSSSVPATPYVHVALDMANTKKSEVESLKNAGSVEAEVVIKHLREARIQVSKSNDMGPSKNLVETLINTIIQEIRGDSREEEDDWLDKLLSRRSSLVFLICIMCIFSLMMVWLLHSSLTASFTGPTPT